MLRTTRAALAAAACAGACLVAGGAAEAQWGPGYGAGYLHAPGYGGYGYGLTTGSRYSLYGPSYGYAAPGYAAPGYGYAAPGYGYTPSACGCSTGYGAGYAPLAGPVAPYGGYSTRAHGEMSYDVYGPYGKQEINYRYHRNGAVSVDVDD